jgi:hypothetical protein
MVVEGIMTQRQMQSYRTSDRAIPSWGFVRYNTISQVQNKIMPNEEAMIFIAFCVLREAKGRVYFV